ncbi:hypothetical protein B1H19_24520 [Streptomyces gilvosporeus]|uniref:DUF4383 domain-containing protein n=1 Tax=Streptomyces gilvosporeus TaxID=553510 RepID=A0A1V0TVD0_9ACTN|nr:hypothetical protein B1H19_24520 [Streptomyces gilvosporeus]
MSLRGVAGLSALLCAVVHIVIAPEHLQEMTYIGVLFLISSVALLLAAAGLARRNPLPGWWLGTLISGGMILGFALSRTVGLPSYHEGTWDPPYGVLSVASESVFIACFVAWYGVEKPHTPPQQVTRPVTSLRVR